MRHQLYLVKLPWEHKKDMHLNRLRQVYDFDTLSQKQYAILTTKEDEQFFEGQWLLL